ncbi:hypothetical protein QQF64_035898 [Cirrhinus molitorella]|uniref:Uncharacterized protein n=1 Tax=Cirrhinus molitorella TaxID=172907 RepID=A0ABR3NH60_9TELE
MSTREKVSNALERSGRFGLMNLACQSTLWNSLGLTSETFTRNLDLKGKRLLDYTTAVCVNKSKKFLQNYARLQRMRGLQSGCSDDVIEMILPLLSYFDEKEESMFFHVEDTCLAEEVQLEQVPLTPVIVCDLGLWDLVSGSEVPVLIWTLTKAGTQDKEGFFSINPEKGTKVENKNSKRRLNMKPRVLTLIQELSDHKWR